MRSSNDPKKEKQQDEIDKLKKEYFQKGGTIDNLDRSATAITDNGNSEMVKKRFKKEDAEAP